MRKILSIVLVLVLFTSCTMVATYRGDKYVLKDLNKGIFFKDGKEYKVEYILDGMNLKIKMVENK